MENQFQTWLKAQGYYRKEDSPMWWKNGEPIHGSELSLKFKEWEREMNKTSVDNYLFTKNHLSRTAHRLGVATTIGELRKMIEIYPDDTSFGFRNQPMQELCEVKYSDVTFVVFQEGLPEAQGEVEKTYRYAIYQAKKAVKNFNDALLTARDQVQKTKKSKQSWMQQILLRPFYLLLKKDMIRLLSKKHGEQFIDDVMQTFEMPTNLMDKYFKLHKNQ